MHRKVTYLLTSVIVCFPIPSILAQDKAATDRLYVAHAQYYTPTAKGLKSFQCEATIDWKALLTRLIRTEVSEDNPILKYLQGVHLSVVDQLNGKGELEWTDTVVPPEGKEDNAKQMRDGLQTMLGGFFQSWNAYMNGTMVPFPDKSVKVSTAGTGVHLRGMSPNMQFDEDFDKDMLLIRATVESPEMKVVEVPTYVRTDDGLVVSAVASEINQPPSAPPIQVNFRVEYARVGLFQLPSHLVYDIKNVGVFEIGLNTCQVSVDELTQKPKAEKSTNPIN